MAGDEGHGLADEFGRDRVVVAIEAKVGRLAAGLGQHEVALEGVLGQREQPRSLFVERLRHGLLGIARTGPAWAHSSRQRRNWALRSSTSRKLSCREEAIAQEADLTLHTSLLVAPGHGTGARQEVVVAGELEEPGMELDGLALAGEDGAS